MRVSRLRQCLSQCLSQCRAVLDSQLHLPLGHALPSPTPSLGSASSLPGVSELVRTWRGLSTSPPASSSTISVTYTDEKDGSTKTCQAPVGENLMAVAHANDVDLEGACEGSLACSTCHIIIESQEMFDKLPEADDDENDMLDLAFGLTETSRLGCQVIATEELDGITVRIPSATRNFAVDGHVPKPH